MGQEGRSRQRRRQPVRPYARRREAVLKHVYVLPNMITSASLFCGILALISIFEGNHEKACWLILFSAMLDACDGAIARLTGTESDFGLHFDSLSDLVAFGVSPAALMLSFLNPDVTNTNKVVTLACTLYIICGALRLARYNVQALGHESQSFCGLPIPAAAGVLITSYLVLHRNPGLELKVAPFLIFIVAFLMISKIPYPSFKSISLKDRKPFDFLAMIAILAVLVHWFDSKELLLLIGFCAYVASPLWPAARNAMDKVHSKIKDKKAAAKSKTQNID